MECERPELVGLEITALAPVGVDAVRTSVRCGPKTVGVVATTEIADLGLRIGTTLTESLIARIEHFSAIEKARTAALRLVNARQYSKEKLAQRLRKRGFDGAVIAPVIERLENAGLLNDAEYGRILIRQIHASKPAGDRLVRSKLAEHGVARALIDELIAQSKSDRPDPMDDPKLERLVVRKMASMQHLDAGTQSRRLFAMLARRGFDAEVARAMVDRHVRMDD
jgi:regulatory protein